MKKNVVQDVVPPKKSIRNVTLSSRPNTPVRRMEEKVMPSLHKEEDDGFTRPVAIKQEAPIRIEQRVEQTPPVRPPVDVPSYKYEFEQPKKPGKKWWYLSVAVLVIVVAFGVSAFFKSAVVRVTPKQESQTLSDTFRATKGATGNTLPFQIVTVSKDMEKTVDATNEQQVDKKAKGTIVIYNETVQVQKLVATTRFQTPEGLIFRLPAGVTVPAKTTVAGKTTAGSIEVQVEADKTGASYNIGLKDFTLPGLKGDPKYTTVYARSKTSMTGGFSGMQKVVSKDVMDKTDTELTASLKASLTNDISNQIPANFILYTGSFSYSLDPIEQTDATTAGAVLKKKGTIYGVIFDRTLLTSTILSKVSPSLSSDKVKITDLESLTFNYPTSTSVDSNTTNISFTLNGGVNIVYTFDENKLKADLLGLSRDKARVVLSTYNSIMEAWVETHPFWNQTIPKDSSKVTLVNTLTK